MTDPFFLQSPFQRLSDFKNPCWISSVTDELPYLKNKKPQVQRIVNEMSKLFKERKQKVFPRIMRLLGMLHSSIAPEIYAFHTVF